MKKLFHAFSVILIIVGLASCSKSNSSAPTTASVMFVDGCAGTTNVNISVNNTQIAAASNLAFLKNTGYQQVTPGTDSITFILANLGTPLKTATNALTAKVNYSVFVGGLITGSTFVILNDDLTAPSSGNAKIRFVNLSTDADTVTANVGNTAIATGIVSQGSSPFTQIAAGSYTIKAGDPSNINTVVSVGPQQLNAGSIYTVMLTGTLSGTGISGLTLTVITNH
jgi:hypothetical protein